MQTLMINPVFFIVAIVILGLCVGSFLNVVIYRLPIILDRDWKTQCTEYLNLPSEKITKTTFNLFLPLSHCPQCKRSIRPWENIPILSYLLLKTKCAGCDTKISIRYPIIEAVTALLSLYVAFHFGWSWQTLAALALTWSLIALTFIDVDHQLLPDTICLPMLWLGLIINYFGLFASLPDALFGAIFGYLSLWTFSKTFTLITGKIGMGHGDFKLFAMLGAWLGWQLLPFIILLSSLVGAIVGISLILVNGRDRNHPIPFGPFISLAGWIALFWGHPLTTAYLGMLG